GLKIAYRIDARFVACVAEPPVREIVPVGANVSIGELWHNVLHLEPHCLVNGHVKKVQSEFRDGRFQWLCLDTGKWVIGCYYSNETHPDVFLKIGEYGYNGLIKHVCDRYGDYPGRVQYYAEVRNDVHVKHPTNKGINKNFPEAADLRGQEEVVRWLRESATLFVANGEPLRGKIRYLPASRHQWPTHHL
uniref:Transposase n=1 Tax=Angiostrongylus cantonensis TaxID=6313 RepID=A0A0K0D3G0_ANGCA